MWGCALISEAPEASAAVDASGPKPAWGGRWEALKAKMKQDFLPTLAAELAVWPVLQAINFSRVPLRHQLLVRRMGA